MIESRYKIAYILPDEDVKKTSVFRVLWYFLLISLVLLAVIGITYDFSVKDISRDSLVLVEKAKVQILNLGDTQEFKPNTTNKAEKEIDAVKTTDKSSTTTASQTTKNIIQKPVVSVTPEPKAKQDKIKISELTSKQELRLKTIKTHIEKNTLLSQDLNQLSEELVLEQIKNQELNSQISSQEKDKKDLEERLNKALEKPYSKKMTLDDLKTQDTKEAILISKSIVTKNNETIQSEPKAVEPVQAISRDVAQEKTVVVIKEIEEVEQSETDKIIEAMANIASEKNESAEATTTITEESEAISKLKSQTKSNKKSAKKEAISHIKTNNDKGAINVVEAINNKEILNNEQVVNPKLLIKDKKPSPIPEPTLVNNEVDIVKTVEVTEVKIEVTTNNALKQPEKIVETDPQAPHSGSTDKSPNQNSAVDDIIAAMQASQTTNNKASNKKIDSELENGINQQLVEQGDLSVDN